jgi:hypothetical protein
LNFIKKKVSRFSVFFAFGIFFSKNKNLKKTQEKISFQFFKKIETLKMNIFLLHFSSNSKTEKFKKVLDTD